MLRTVTLAVLLIVTALPVMAECSAGDEASLNRNYNLAIREYKACGRKGDAASQYSVGEMYIEGMGVPKSDRKAFKWLLMAAKQGFVVALASVGLMYAQGRGVPRNYVLAYFWSSLAAARGQPAGARNVELLEKRMTRADVSRAQAMAAKWKPKKAKQTK